MTEHGKHNPVVNAITHAVCDICAYDDMRALTNAHDDWGSVDIGSLDPADASNDAGVDVKRTFYTSAAHEFGCAAAVEQARGAQVYASERVCAAST